MAQDLVNGSVGASRMKSSASRVVPAIPLALGGRRKTKTKSDAPHKIVAAEATTPTPADSGAAAEAAVEEIAVESTPNETPLEPLEQKNELAEDSVAAQEIESAADNAEAVFVPADEPQHDGLNGETPDSSVEESVPPSQESDTTVEGQAQDGISTKPQQEDGVPLQASQSVKSPVVFGGHVDSDATAPELAQPQVAQHRLSAGDRSVPNGQVFVPQTSRAPPGLQHAVQYAAPTVPHPVAQYVQPLHTYQQPHAQADNFAPQSLANGLPYRTHQDVSYGRPDMYQQPRPAAYNPQAPVYTRPESSLQAHHASVNGFTPHDSFHERQARNSFSQIEQERRRSSVPTNGETPALRPDAQPIPSNLDRDTGVAQFIHSQFGSAEFADYILRLAFPPQFLPAHGIVLARSPRLRSLMAMPPQFYNGNYKLLDIHITDRFLTHDLALMKALMRLYGEAFPDGNWVLSMSGAQARHAARHEAMRFSLSYAAAGHYLQVEDIVMAGLSLSASILTWETMSMYLAFALDGGVGPAFSSSFEAPSFSDSSSHDGNGTPSKQLESLSSSPTYGIYSDRAVHNLIGFLMHHWPADFKFDESAPQFPEVARLPATSEPPSRHNRHTSRMSQIRFGDMTREEEGASNVVHTTLSSILLTLPFSLLAHIFGNNILGQRFGYDKTADLMHAVVNEREQRRIRAVQSRKSAPPGLPLMTEDRLWSNTRWVEAVETSEQHPAKCRLVRHLSTSEAPSGLISVDGGSVSSS